MLSGSRRCQSYDHLETPGFIAPTNEQGTPAWVPPTWCSLDFAGWALVAQWIEQRFPKPRAEVRFLPGARPLTCANALPGHSRRALLGPGWGQRYPNS